MSFTYEMIKKLLDALFTSLNSHIDKGADKVVKAVNEQSSEAVSKAINTQTVALGQALTQVSKAMDRISTPEIEVDVNFDSLKDILKSINSNLASLVKRQSPDFKKIETQLSLLLTAVKENTTPDYRETFDVFGKSIKELKPKNTIRIDDDQLNKLANVIGNSAPMATAGGVKSASTYSVKILSMANANTEYAFTFPRGTLSWTMKLRTAGQSLYFASATGKLPISGDATEYMTLLPGLSAQSQDNVEYGGTKMYFESDGASQTVEFMIAQL